MCFQDSLLRAESITSHRHTRGPVGGAVLNALSLSLAPGDTVRLAGPSGAGKSTLLWALARMLPIAGGRLVLNGRPAADWPAPAWRDRVALVLQKHSLVKGTVRDNLLLPWTLKIRGSHAENWKTLPERQEKDAHSRSTPPGEETMRHELDTLGLADAPLDAKASRLSVGQTARLSLARTLLTAPECLLLDEPLAALDADSAANVLARIDSFSRDGGAVLMVSHNHLATGNALPGRRRTLHLEGGTLTESTP